MANKPISSSRWIIFKIHFLRLELSFSKGLWFHKKTHCLLFSVLCSLPFKFIHFPPKECKRTQGVSTTNLVGRLEELFVKLTVFIIFSSGCCCSARSTCKLEAKNTRWITFFVPLPSLRHEIMIIELCKYIRPQSLQIAKPPGRPKGLHWHEHRGGGTLPMDRTLPVLANNPKAPRVFQRWGQAPTIL